MENKVNVLSKEERQRLNDELFYTIKDVRIKDVKVLIKQGADVNAISINGRTPLHDAVVRACMFSVEHYTSIL
jgi:ankyrin repeat protein